jgi:hypothetical protein
LAFLPGDGARLVPCAEADTGKGGNVKFCKDCKRYTPATSADGGTLLPGVFLHIPAQCTQGMHTDIVTGETRMKTMDCAKSRANEELCGIDGVNFEPATLDGRLAMLDV